MQRHNAWCVMQVALLKPWDEAAEAEAATAKNKPKTKYVVIVNSTWHLRSVSDGMLGNWQMGISLSGQVHTLPSAQCHKVKSALKSFAWTGNSACSMSIYDFHKIWIFAFPPPTWGTCAWTPLVYVHPHWDPAPFQSYYAPGRLSLSRGSM